MPTAAVDLFLASSAMLLIILGAIYGVNTVVKPHLEEVHIPLDRYHPIGKYMLLSRGEPEGWGAGGDPTVLGFASDGGAYELDIDKVTRLNPSNAHAVNYSRLWQAQGIDDVSFRIRVEPLFNVTLSPVSSQSQGDETAYTFSASTTRRGYPLPASLRYYVAVRDHTASGMGSTGADGTGAVEFTLPNSLNGTALLVVLARVEQSVTSYGVLRFSHSSGPVDQDGTFATLSPHNYTLDVNVSGGASALNAAVFSYGYVFNLTTGAGGSYTVPRLLDASPMVLVVTGLNGSSYWAEWTAYPQVPLVVGADMSDSHAISDVASISYVVKVKGALYSFEVRFRSPAEDD